MDSIFRLIAFAVVLFAATVAGNGKAADVPASRVLFIGIDGCRFDAVEAAKTPHLDRLMADGCYSKLTMIFGKRYRLNDTVSGPGWSSLLTGVWADKHGVIDNRFTVPRYDLFPHFFKHVKEAYPKAMTASIASWPPICDRITSHADVNRKTSSDKHYVPGDRESMEQAVGLLRNGNPTALFVYFGQVDESGHQFGFHPTVPEYVAAIERVDDHIGEVTAALRARPNFAAENWLILVSSDHGGKGKDHGGGHLIPDVLKSFAIVSGAAADRGAIGPGPTYLVDLPVTALTHLGVTIDPRWDLDGQAIGLKKP